jgi:hypothetical protein
MPQKLPNINCQCYQNGNCLHHAAPRRWIGKPQCVLLNAPKDPRTKEGCALQYEYPRPDAPLRPPPARVIQDGVSYDTLMPPNASLSGAEKAQLLERPS